MPFYPRRWPIILRKQTAPFFTIIPWFGYATFGGFLSVLFTRYKNFKYLYGYAITSSILAGLALIFLSSKFLISLFELSGMGIFKDIAMNNYLFIRLGDVFLVFAIFMLFRAWMTHSTILRVGQEHLVHLCDPFYHSLRKFYGNGALSFLSS